MLRDIVTMVTDGLLGLSDEKGEGVHVKIGVSTVVSAAPIAIDGNMAAAKIKLLLGLSPLADKVMDSVVTGASLIYCIPVAASTAGEAGEVTKTGTGSGSMTVAGDPNNAFSVIVIITGLGRLNTALFRYSIDGGYSYSAELTVPLNGVYAIPLTGLTVTFTEGAEPNEATSFLVDDTYAFATTAPAMTNADALAAIDKLRNISDIEWVHIVGESQPALWAAVAAQQEVLTTTYRKPLMFVLEAYAPDADETVDEYAARLLADKSAVSNTDIQIVAARSIYTGMDGVTREINNAGIICGLYAKAPVQQSIGKTRDTARMGIARSKMLELRPTGIEDYLGLLDAAQFLTFREYEGLPGYYVTNARVMAPEGSDYRYAEDVRIKNKIIRSIRREGLQLLQDDIDMENVQAELEARAAFMTSPLDKMIDLKQISSAKIIVPTGQDIIATETMFVIVRYVSRGYIREIKVDLGRTKPTSV